MLAIPTPVSAATFERQVTSSPVPVLVDFWAPWCSTCKQLMPSVQGLSEQRGDRLRVVTVDIADNETLAQQFGVLSVPCLLVIQDGRELGRGYGRNALAELSPILDRVLAGAA